MKPLAFQIGKRILILFGSPIDLEDVALAKNSRANLVLVKVELDT